MQSQARLNPEMKLQVQFKAWWLHYYLISLKANTF